MIISRCAYLDQDGEQCRLVATETQALHIDGETYSWIHDPFVPDTDTRTLSTWVAAPLCRLHAKAFDSTKVVRGKVQ